MCFRGLGGRDVAFRAVNPGRELRRIEHNEKLILAHAAAGLRDQIHDGSLGARLEGTPMRFEGARDGDCPIEFFDATVASSTGCAVAAERTKSGIARKRRTSRFKWNPGDRINLRHWTPLKASWFPPHASAGILPGGFTRYPDGMGPGT
jgi:hypothetical protein